jgi:hypothetical protein
MSFRGAERGGGRVGESVTHAVRRAGKGGGGSSMGLFSNAAHDLAARIAISDPACHPVRPARQLNRRVDRLDAPSGEGAAAPEFRLGGSGMAGTFDPDRPVASLDQLYSQASYPNQPKTSLPILNHSQSTCWGIGGTGLDLGSGSGSGSFFGPSLPPMGAGG